MIRGLMCLTFCSNFLLRSAGLVMEG
jgi:hypothetical protein